MGSIGLLVYDRASFVIARVVGKEATWWEAARSPQCNNDEGLTLCSQIFRIATLIAVIAVHCCALPAPAEVRRQSSSFELIAATDEQSECARVRIPPNAIIMCSVG